jgi:PAS domain S-box-containing protein
MAEPEFDAVIDGSARVTGWRVPDREHDRLLALHRVSTLVTQQRRTEDVLREALKSAVALVGGDAGSIHRWLPETERLRCVMAHGRYEPLVRGELAPGEGVTGRTFLSQTPQIVNDYATSGTGTAVSRAAGLKTCVAVPIAPGARCLGILSVGSYDERRTFGLDDASLLDLFASVVAVAWENAELYAELEHRLGRIRMLSQLSRLVSTSLDLDHVLPRIARAAVELTGATFATFWLTDASSQTLRLSATSDDDIGQQIRVRDLRFGEGLAGWVAQRREPLKVDDVVADGRCRNLDWWERTGLRSSLTLPVFDGTGQGHALVAVLSLNGREPFRLPEPDVELLESFLAQAAVAIRNASLYSTIRRSQEQLQQIVDHSPAAISLKDRDGRYLLTNGRWRERFLGDAGANSEQRPLGKTDAELFPPTRSERTRERDIHVLTAGATIEYEATVVENGERRTYLSVKFPLVDLAGQPYAVCTISTDITLRKRSEEEIAAALAAHRTANAQLQELSRAKSDFVSIVSHEFRSPLTSIQGFSEMMREGELTLEEMREFSADINREAERLSRMIGELLDLDQLEAGQMMLRLEQVDLLAIIRQVVGNAAPRAARHQLVVDVAPGLAAVRGDADKLTQVLVNLLDNAIKYSPDGGEVRLTGWIEADTVRLRVEDQGLGIPPDALETVFERYRRLELDPEHRVIQGTGLGLPIVRQIVELHGGEVWAESVQGQGATFHVRLPLGRLGS